MELSPADWQRVQLQLVVPAVAGWAEVGRPEALQFEEPEPEQQE